MLSRNNGRQRFAHGWHRSGYSYSQSGRVNKMCVRTGTRAEDDYYVQLLHVGPFI